MIRSEEIAENLRGVWRMARGDPAWRDSLDCSTEGVFRSFWAAALAAPLILMSHLAMRRAASSIASDLGQPPQLSPLPASLTLQGAAFAADWALSLGVLLVFVRIMNAGHGAAALVSGYNWSQVIAAVAMFAATVIVAILPAKDVAIFATLAAASVSIYLTWGVVRRSLGLPPATAIAAVALVLMVGLIVTQIAGAFLPAPVQAG